ncbi:MAG: methyltransferase domain-containing protein [Acidobacteriota bacterium]|nr:methyltransferase domain-containing protein [Acidobacteriota bacterium]
MENTMDYVHRGWRRRVKSGASRLLGSLGVLHVAFKCREWLAPLRPRVLWRNLRWRLREGGDGPPIPSSKARYLVAGGCDIGWFVEGGALGAETVREALARNGYDLARVESLLDFGCGCGRVLRHLGDLPGSIHGVELQPYLVTECRRTVPFASVSTGSPEPPLPFEDESFDLIYCFSVFTHLTDGQQILWRDEIRRVLRPDGLWIVTTQGIPYLPRLSRREQDRFRSGLSVCQNGEYRGRNFCQAYHPEVYVRDTLASGFTVLDFVPEGAKGNPVQDLYLLARDG